MFFSLLVLTPDDMHPPLKNHLSGSIVVVFQVFFLLYVVKSYQRIFNSFSDCLNHGFQTFPTITASLMFMGTISLKLRVLGITWKNTYNGQGKDNHPSWQCIPHSVFKYRLAPLRVLRTSSHHFVVAPPSSNSFTILCIVSNFTAPTNLIVSLFQTLPLTWQGDPQSQVLKSLFHRPNLGKNMVGLQKVYSDSVV